MLSPIAGVIIIGAIIFVKFCWNNGWNLSIVLFIFDESVNFILFTYLSMDIFKTLMGRTVIIGQRNVTSLFYLGILGKRGITRGIMRGNISSDLLVGALRWLLEKLTIRFVAENDDNTET